MPVIGAILGAIVMGVIYWMIWGGGMEYVSSRLDASGEEKRRALNAERSRAAAEERRRAAIKALSESRDGAVALMLLVARERGEPTTEQIVLIKSEMSDMLDYGDELDERLVLARHAVEVAPSPDTAILDLRELMRTHLTRAELAELFAMLRKVADLHGGPTDAQERMIAQVECQFASQRG